MRDYFHGRGKKTGVALLATACVVIGCWIRTIITEDIIVLAGRTSNYFFISGGQAIALMLTGQWQMTRRRSLVGQVLINKITSAPDEPFISLSNSIELHAWPVTQVSVGQCASISQFAYDLSPQTGMIPYWALLIRLTVLSKFLLLSSPAHRSKSRDAGSP